MNNAVLPGTAMPHVLAALQGLQRPRYEQVTGKDGKATEHLVGLERWACRARCRPPLTTASCVTPSLSSNTSPSPHKAKRQSLGVWVILFLLMFTAFTWFLYKEYWKDVK